MALTGTGITCFDGWAILGHLSEADDPRLLWDPDHELRTLYEMCAMEPTLSAAHNRLAVAAGSWNVLVRPVDSEDIWWALAFELNRPGFCIRSSQSLRGSRDASKEGFHA
jgi:hypothetical protein